MYVDDIPLIFITIYQFDELQMTCMRKLYDCSYSQIPNKFLSQNKWLLLCVGFNITVQCVRDSESVQTMSV